ncbi:F-type H+-transporting ATPase subunit b [Pseudorhodobacter antarcticus]|jgi:F-type H+-transporting ATPase subunit b|uniref:ATP synthase subunit b n=1 Tax=Pseudorhodobacter antarcticus TaxID=1077947 RepID=A0A1H8B4R4_9RHOB|nr:F0F1 ATP synthase subunit B' [Pseudorhodobacter antarcticus]SEM76857.1 F-type H+-transporting ATPase subunit b [Pseudorhodobacter antarcticus]
MSTEAVDATAAAHGATATVKMPQLDISTFDNQIFWLLVALVAIYMIVTRVAVPRIGAVLAERRGTITNDLAAAEELKLKAVEAETAYNKALATARAEAAKIVAAAKADIEADLAKASAKADAQIEAKTVVSEQRIADIRAGAMESVSEVANDTAKELVAVLGGKADAKAITAAVTARMKG